MKNKYLVVDPYGDVVDPEVYLHSKECDPEFKIVIEREALGINAHDDSSKKPNYLKYAHKLGFDWEPNSDMGFLQYNYKADLIMRLVKEYARQLVNELDLPIYEVRGANFFDMDHPVVEAYAGLFGDRLFIHEANNKKLVMSYDASYPHFNLANRSIVKEGNMPYAHFSISDCYRYEQSGECMMLFRGRRFFMPDIHLYLKDLDEAFEWYFKLEEKLLKAAKMANRKYWNVAKVSSIENWEKYQDRIIEVAVHKGEPVLIEICRDGLDRYWIIDVDYSIIDELEQVREIGCIQIDVGNAGRLGIVYKNEAGEDINPVIIHAAIPGGIERFIYMLVDQFEKSFPFWLAPVQVRILPVGGKHYPAIEELLEKMHNLQLRVEIDDRAESISKRIKLSHEDLVPEYVVFGDREVADSRPVAVLLRDLDASVRYFPFIPAQWPRRLSKQLRS